MKELFTNRLRLRGLRAADAPHLAAMSADPEVMRYVGSGVRTYENALAEAQRLVAEERDDGLGLWAIEERSTGDFHGRVGLLPLDDSDEIEVAYRLPRTSWGRGIATEAAGCLIVYGFDDLGLDEIVAVTSPDNAASRRVLEKLGLEHRSARTVYGVEGCWYYVLSRAAWRRRRDTRVG
ncbi:MAG: GNAT family N-acetyltransferase [Alphaproteobacteria bacterium]